MPYQFTQTGAEIQDILDQVPVNTGDISALNTTLTNLSSSGTWTPAIPRANLTTASGKWYKIGDAVFLTGLVTFSSSQTNQGDLYINGTSLPSVARSRAIGGVGAAVYNYNLASGSANDNIWIAQVGTGRIPATQQNLPGSTLQFVLMSMAK